MNLEQVTISPIHLKIAQFFHENQASIDTPRGVATWIGEDRQKVKDALEDLVKLRILVPHRTSSTTGYSYTRDPKIMKEVANLLTKE